MFFATLVVVEVGGGDLEGEEEKAGAAWVDVVEGDTGDEVADTLLAGDATVGTSLKAWLT